MNAVMLTPLHMISTNGIKDYNRYIRIEKASQRYKYTLYKTFMLFGNSQDAHQITTVLLSWPSFQCPNIGLQ